MDALLVNLPPWEPTAPPVGLASVVGAVRHAGFQVEVLDSNARIYRQRPDLLRWWSMSDQERWFEPSLSRETIPLLQRELDSEIRAMVDSRAPVLGFVIAAPRQQLIYWVLGRLRDLDYEGRVFLGGPSTFVADDRAAICEATRDSIDAIVVGEGERATTDLLRCWTVGADATTGDGVLSLRDNGGCMGPVEWSPMPMSELPVPDYGDFDLGSYTGDCLRVEWGRGCTRRCRFCEVYSMWGARRSKRPAQIVEEMDANSVRTGIESFVVSDPAVNADHEQFVEVLRLLKESSRRFAWTGNFQVDKRISPDVVNEMVESGCRRLEIGIESGSDRVLRRMRKGSTSARNQTILRRLKRAGVETVGYFLVGFPGETEEDFEATIAFIERNAEYIDSVRSANSLVLQHGAPILEEVQREGEVRPGEGPRWGEQWRIGTTNTPSIRRARMDSLKRCLLSLGIPFDHTAGC